MRALLLALLVVACGGTTPRAIALGEDACGYCRMEVTDARFAAQAITRTGRVHVFDSIDCLAGYVRAADAATLVGLWVTDADQPGRFVPAESAGYLRGSALRGPMGTTVAFASVDAARAAQARFGGQLAEWAVIRADTSAHGH